MLAVNQLLNKVKEASFIQQSFMFYFTNQTNFFYKIPEISDGDKSHIKQDMGMLRKEAYTNKNAIFFSMQQ